MDTHSSIHSASVAKRCLGAIDLTLIGVGSIVGAGIFVMVGQAAALYAGPAVVISLLISGGCCCFYALCYCELASFIPEGGSAYSYSREAFGTYVAWFVAWNLILEYIFGAAAIAIGWSGYFCGILNDVGVHVPSSWTKSAFNFTEAGGMQRTDGTGNIPAVLIVLLCTSILAVGIEESARVNNIIVSIKIAVLLVFILGGMWFVNLANYDPFLPPNTGAFGDYGFSGVLRASSVMLFAYIGFDTVSTCAAEANDPERTIPLGILGSLGISGALYVGTAAVLTGLVPYSRLDVADPMAAGVAAAGPALAWMRPVVGVGATLGLGSGVLVSLLGQARILQAVAADGLLPSFLAVRGGVRGGGGHTPLAATAVSGAACAAVAWAVPLRELGELVSVGTLVAFAAVCAAVVALRERQPDRPRPFRVPLYPVVPAMGVAVAVLQVLSLSAAAWVRLLAWVAVGLLLLVALRLARMRAPPLPPPLNPPAPPALPSAAAGNSLGGGGGGGSGDARRVSPPMRAYGAVPT